MIRGLFMPPWLMGLALFFSYHLIKGLSTPTAIPWQGMFFAWLVALTYRVWKLEKDLRKE